MTLRSANIHPRKLGTHLMLIPLLAASLMVQPAAASDTLVLEGRCEYPEAVRQRQFETVLAICNQLTIAREDGEMVITFGPRGLGPTMIFSGKADGNRMEVQQVTLRRGDIESAEGTCEIFYTDGEISVVSCLASSLGRSWAGNFVNNRI